ncbi:lipopolysaccharide biosynthesis protein [Pseudotenacibaculum haliotis]|uniref:Lipopolysaccharide biosynthesis protein n=1 Tax=Pseudotenacibaculum haliotis TaxID=1862138 RepID=A0ABW5LTX8_9FLAO
MFFLKKVINRLDTDFSELLSHAKNYVSADVLAKGLVFLSIPILTRLLTTEDYGVLGVFTSITSMLIIIFGLGIRGSVTRYYYEDKNDFDKFLGTNISLLLGFGLISLSGLYFFKDIFSSFFETSPNLFTYACLVAFFSVMFEIYQAYLQASKRSKEYSILSMIKSFCTISLTITIILLLEKEKYLGQVFAELIVIFLISFYSLFRVIKISKINFEKKYITYSLVFGIPVVFHLISQTVLSSFDQIIINQLVGEKETGIYSFAYQIGLIQSIISMGILKAWTPIFYEKKKNKEHKDIENLAKKYSVLIYILALCLMLFSYEIIYIMADEKFHSSQTLVPIIVLSYVFFFLYTLYVGYSFYHKKTYLIAVFSLITGVANIALNYVFIPIYGFQAAAYTTLVSFIILFGLHYINVKLIIKEENIIRLKRLLPNLVLIIFVFLLFVGIKSFLTNYLLILFTKLLLIGLVVVFFMKKRAF